MIKIGFLYESKIEKVLINEKVVDKISFMSNNIELDFRGEHILFHFSNETKVVRSFKNYNTSVEIKNRNENIYDIMESIINDIYLYGNKSIRILINYYEKDGLKIVKKLYYFQEN